MSALQTPSYIVVWLALHIVRGGACKLPKTHHPSRNLRIPSVGGMHAHPVRPCIAMNTKLNVQYMLYRGGMG
jgi:hypothetical protein